MQQRRDPQGAQLHLTLIAAAMLALETRSTCERLLPNFPRFLGQAIVRSRDRARDGMDHGGIGSAGRAVGGGYFAVCAARLAALIGLLVESCDNRNKSCPDVSKVTCLMGIFVKDYLLEGVHRCFTSSRLVP